MIICRRPSPQKYCQFCGKPATKLCDYPVANDKTCDVPMCNDCAKNIGIEKDYCPAHYSRYLSEKSGNVTRTESRQPATWKQIDFIKSLCRQTGYDPDNYNFAAMTKEEASEIISEMLKDA
jgi:protein-arginine kinase activator protein McsA